MTKVMVVCGCQLNTMKQQITNKLCHLSERWRFGAVGSEIGRINEVTLRRARLVLEWVTVSGFNSCCGKFISV